MVKILLDPSMYHPHLTVAQECEKAADLGYADIVFGSGCTMIGSTSSSAGRSS